MLEQRIPLRRELSVLAVRGRDGDDGLLPAGPEHPPRGHPATSVRPRPTTSARSRPLAEEYARRILTALEYVGVLALELFVDDRDGRLLANEIAPRVHNSGHWTIEGAETSQFENHLRAILGLPLGSTAPRGWSAMVNLIGAVPSTERSLAIPGAHLHLYGKAPRPGRKLGHVTVTARRCPPRRAAGPRPRSR